MEGKTLHTYPGNLSPSSVQTRSSSMEIMIAVVMFAAIIAAWFVLPTSSR